MAGIETEGAYGLGRFIERRAPPKRLTQGRDLTKNRLITGADGLPESQGLFDVSKTRDSCGVGFIAHMKGVKSHAIVQDALRVLENLEHRVRRRRRSAHGRRRRYSGADPARLLRARMRKAGLLAAGRRQLRHRPAHAVERRGRADTCARSR